MAKPHNLLLAYYGDDFTGSTDALEFLSRAGIKTVLFITGACTGAVSEVRRLAGHWRSRDDARYGAFSYGA